jgi:hypothetical protein
MKSLADLLTQVKSGMKDCSSLKADWSKLEQMVEILNSPTSIAYHVGKDLLVNGQDIFHELETAVTDYEAANWTDFGYQVGEAASKTIIGVKPPKTEEQIKLDRIMLEQIVEGVLRGSLHAEGFDDINHCITDAEHVFGDAEAAYKDFKAGGATNVINGMKSLADLLSQVKSGMKDCSNLKADWNKLEEMVEIFNSPTSFAYHVGKDLLVNGNDIFHELETAVTDYESSNWSDFGYQVGEAAAKTIVGAKPVTNSMPGSASVKTANILKGVIEAYGGHFSLDALLACVHDEDQGLLIITEAFGLLKSAV